MTVNLSCDWNLKLSHPHTAASLKSVTVPSLFLPGVTMGGEEEAEEG